MMQRAVAKRPPIPTTTLTVLVMGMVACGDNTTPSSTTQDADAAMPDAFVYNGPCWPAETAMPHGSITLGNGQYGYEPMPDTLPIVYGLQDGYMFIVNARMTGYAPGNPADWFDPQNPRTRIRAFFADTNVSLQGIASCPRRLPYKDIGNGQFELVDQFLLVFETCWRSDNLVGKQIRIEAEILDYAGTAYASDTHIVTAGLPDVPLEQGSPGCPPP